MQSLRGELRENRNESRRSFCELKEVVLEAPILKKKEIGVRKDRRIMTFSTHLHTSIVASLGPVKIGV